MEIVLFQKSIWLVIPLVSFIFDVFSFSFRLKLTGLPFDLPEAEG
jgi:hypothetical protein